MDYFKSCGSTIFEVPGFMKLACVKLKLPANQSSAPRVSRCLLREALANLRSRNLLASIPTDPQPEILVVFDTAPESLRRILQPLELPGTARLIDLGDGIRLNYASLDIFDFASPEFQSSLHSDTGTHEHFTILLAFLDAVEERFRRRLAVSDQLTRLSAASFQDRPSSANPFSIHTTFNPTAAVVEFKVTPCCGPILEPIIPDDPPKTHLYLAPCGIRATLVRTLSFNFTPPPSEIQSQLKIIEKWLSARALPPQVINCKAPLALLEIDVQSPLTRPTSNTTSGHSLLYWPASLCFKVRHGSSRSIRPDGDEIRHLLSNDYRDPLQIASTWRNQKLERDVVSARFPASPDNIEEDKLSPLSGLRETTDLQASSAVYPTPPDGPGTQNTPGSISVEGAQLSEPEAQDETVMDLDKPLHEQPATPEPLPDDARKASNAGVTITEDDFDFFNDGSHSPAPEENAGNDNTEPSEDVERTAVAIQATTSPQDNTHHFKPTKSPAGSPSASLTPEAVKLRLNPSDARPNTSPPGIFELSSPTHPTSVSQSDIKHATASRFDFDNPLLKENNTKELDSPSHPGRSPWRRRRDSDSSASEDSSSSLTSDESDSSSLGSALGAKRPVPTTSTRTTTSTADSIFRHVLPPKFGTRPEKSDSDNPALEDHAALQNLLESCFSVASVDKKAPRTPPVQLGFGSNHHFDSFTDGDKIATIQHFCKQVPAYSAESRQITTISAHVNSFLFAELVQAFPKARQKHPFSFVMVTDKDGFDRSLPVSLDDRKLLVSLRERFVELPDPFVRVQKNSTTWEMLPSALRFWETLGLAPANGPKFFSAFVLCPGGDELKTAGDNFLKQFSNAYRSHRLGNVQHGWHDKPDSAFFSLHDEGSADASLDEINKACGRFGRELARRGCPERRVAVFLVDPHECASSLFSISACFQTLLNAYTGAMDKAKPRPRADVQLHVLPMSMMVKADAMRILLQDEASVMAHQVYDKFMPLSRSAKGMNLPVQAAASIELAKPLPKSIPFELSSRAPDHLMLQDSVMHISYAMDEAHDWLSAAWIDDAGRCSFTRCYHLAGRPFAEIALEIWQTTLEAIAGCKVRWRLFVASAGPCPPAERDTWQAIFRKHPAPDTSASLLAVWTTPDFEISPHLLPRPAPSPSHTPATGHSSSSSSANTPTSSTTASAATAPPVPDASGAATPAPSLVVSGPSEGDPAARLTSPLDQAWCLVIAAPVVRLAVPPRTTARPSLASALLLKRASVADDAPPAFVQVDLLSTGEVAREANAIAAPGSTVRRRYEELVKEVVGQYRGLALLARVRGVGGEKEVTPWHVAIAERAVQVLADGVAL